MRRYKDYLKKVSRVENRWFTLLLLFTVVIVGSSIFRDLKKAKEVEKIIKKEEEEVFNLRKKRNELEKRIEETKDIDNIERQLRDKLGLARENEIIIVLPDDETLRSFSPKLEEEKEIPVDPNWKKWVKIFGFYK